MNGKPFTPQEIETRMQAIEAGTGERSTDLEMRMLATITQLQQIIGQQVQQAIQSQQQSNLLSVCMAALAKSGAGVPIRIYTKIIKSIPANYHLDFAQDEDKITFTYREPVQAVNRIIQLNGK